jgi:hypothetical protein
MSVLTYPRTAKESPHVLSHCEKKKFQGKLNNTTSVKCKPLTGICTLVYKSQQDAQVAEFILADNCPTCFGRHYHPSSGAQNNCNYSIW